MTRRRVQADCYEYVRNCYHVPAYVGVRVTVKGREGVLVAPRSPDQYVYILFDGDTRVTGPFHPDDSIRYHPIGGRAPSGIVLETERIEPEAK